MPAKKTKKKVRTVVRKAAPKKAVKGSAKKSTKKTTASASEKKTATKKTSHATKSAAKKSSKKKQLVHAEGNTCFWVYDGPVLSNLYDLREALEGMSEDQFFYHVRDEINDFARWVDDVLEDAECAQKLAKVKDKKKAVRVVKTHLKLYG